MQIKEFRTFNYDTHNFFGKNLYFMAILVITNTNIFCVTQLKYEMLEKKMSKNINSKILIHKFEFKNL